MSHEIDPSMRELILPERDRREMQLFEKRQEQEHVATERREDFASRFTMGAPQLPHAQVVFNAAKGVFGVAVQGAPFVCELPKGYEAQGLELALIEGDRYVATFPGKGALLIDPQRGSVRKL